MSAAAGVQTYTDAAVAAFQDVHKLHKQIQRCYAVNRRAAHPVQVSGEALAQQSRVGVAAG